MRKNISGSILVWSLYLMGVMMFSFLFLSIKIQKNIERNISDSQKNTPFIQNSIPRKYILKKDEEILFSSSKSIFGKITLNSGGPIEYNNGIKMSYVENGWRNFVFSGSLLIKNLGGITDVSIDFSSSEGISYPYIQQEYTKNIGGKEFVVGKERR